MLRIKNFADGSDIPLVRDVRHQHPDWVHDVLGSESEAELQSFLDCIGMQDYVDAAAEGYDVDATGVYYAGPIWRVGASVEVEGRRVNADQHEVLGPAYGVYYADKDEAEQVANGLQDEVGDYDLDPSIQYRVVRVR